MGNILVPGGFSIELQNLYCLGKQLTSKQASKRDLEANKQASKQASRRLPIRAIKQAEGCFACLLACLLASLFYSQELNRFIIISKGYSRFTKRDFFRTFWIAWKKTIKPKNIASRWKRTGIYL